VIFQNVGSEFLIYENGNSISCPSFYVSTITRELSYVNGCSEKYLLKYVLCNVGVVAKEALNFSKDSFSIEVNFNHESFLILCLRGFKISSK
jgi:hypothetical protein